MFRRFAHMGLHFAEGRLDRIEVWRVRRKIKQHRARRFDRLRDTGDLVYRKIVHDHDIAALECGNETLLYVSEKHRSIDGPFEHEGGDHRAIPQPGHERDCFPLSVPRVADQPLSTQAATSQPHHAGGRACLAGWLGGLAPIADFNPLLQMASGVYLTFFGSFVFGTPGFPLSDVPLQSIANDVAAGRYKAKPSRILGSRRSVRRIA